MRAVLCIGGLDPSGGAGLLADAEAVWAAGARPLAAATAITVQSRRGVAKVVVLAPALVVAQVEQLLDDEAPAAVKLGMLGNAAVARALAGALANRLGKRPLVIDPVLRSTSGAALFRGNARRDYRALFALARVVTPNVLEAEELLGQRLAAATREEQAGRLAEALGTALILKGGHLAGSADDLVFDAGRITRLAARRLPGTRRGTGCRFASFLAVRLAQGEGLVPGARAAKEHVRKYLADRKA
jgi:hydroxymethylpyrimidine/phosphomethylpyrimidine kinase